MSERTWRQKPGGHPSAQEIRERCLGLVADGKWISHEPGLPLFGKVSVMTIFAVTPVSVTVPT